MIIRIILPLAKMKQKQILYEFMLKAKCKFKDMETIQLIYDFQKHTNDLMTYFTLPLNRTASNQNYTIETACLCSDKNSFITSK